MYKRLRIKLRNFSSRKRRRRGRVKSCHAYLLKRFLRPTLIVFILVFLVIDYGTNRVYGEDLGYTSFSEITILNLHGGSYYVNPETSSPIALHSVGPTGLFTIYDGDTLRKGEFTFSVDYSSYDLLLNTTTSAQQVMDAHHVLFSPEAYVQVIKQTVAMFPGDLQNKAHLGTMVSYQLNNWVLSASYWKDMVGNDPITETAPFIVVREEQGNAVDYYRDVSRSGDLKQIGLSARLKTETDYPLLGGSTYFTARCVRTYGNKPNIVAATGDLFVGSCTRSGTGNCPSVGSHSGNGINPGATDTHSSYVVVRLDRFGNCVSPSNTTRDWEAAFVGRYSPLSGQSPERSEYGMSQKPTRRKEKIRLTLDISPETNVIIEELAETIGGTKSEVLRRAIALMKFVADARSEGKRFGIAEKGQPLVAEIIGL